MNAPKCQGHQVDMNPRDVDRLRAWLESPSGAFVAGRVTIEAVEGGGILIRTRPYC